MLTCQKKNSLEASNNYKDKEQRKKQMIVHRKILSTDRGGQTN